MIIQHRDDGILMVTQAEHARLAAEFARKWAMLRPEPYEALIRATEIHDDGWIEWDRSPTLQHNGEPDDFTSVAPAERVAIYRRGIASAADEPLGVRLVVSTHLTGLFMGRYQADRNKLVERLTARDSAEVAAFVKEQEGWQRNNTASVIREDVAKQYRLLQVFDVLSLILCTQPSGRIDPRQIDHVPTSKSETSLSVSEKEGVVVLAPYPFDHDGLKVSFTGKLLTQERFESREELRALLDQAPAVEVAFRMSSR